MAQLQSLVVADGQATPVNVTFVPKDIDKNGVARLKSSNGVPIGDKMFTFSLRQTGTKYKGRITLALPVVVNETINGVVVPVVTRTSYMDVNVTFADTSSVQERKDTLALMGNALKSANALITSTFVDLEGIY